MTPTITTQTVVTKEKVNLSLDMNTDLFWTYIKQRFNKDFANLVCHELNFFVPIAFNSIENLDSLKKYVDRRLEKLDANSIKIYFEHEGDCQSKLIMNKAYLMVLDNFREEITQLINKKKKPFGGVTFSDSTDTSTDNLKMRSKKRKSEIGDTRERVQRLRRQVRIDQINIVEMNGHFRPTSMWRLLQQKWDRHATSTIVTIMICIQSDDSIIFAASILSSKRQQKYENFNIERNADCKCTKKIFMNTSNLCGIVEILC